MNQEKIGAFIVECRKNKKMTQEELANKLGVNHRSVSRWENGKCMPDISLLKSLCEELDITLNELLVGEKNNNKDYNKKVEENLINSIKETKKLSKEKRNLIIVFIIIIITLLCCFAFVIFKSNYEKRYYNNYPSIISIYSNIASDIMVNLYNITEGNNCFKAPDGLPVISEFGESLKDFDIEDDTYEKTLQQLTKDIHYCYYEELNRSAKLGDENYESLKNREYYLQKSKISKEGLKEINELHNASKCLTNIVAIKDTDIAMDEAKVEGMNFILENVSSFMNSDLYKKKDKTFDEIVITDLFTLILILDLSKYLASEYDLVLNNNGAIGEYTESWFNETCE